MELIDRQSLEMNIFSVEVREYESVTVIDADEIRNASTIDPIHAAGGCYCGECVRSEELKDQRTGESRYCRFFNESMDKTDFCSYGIPKNEE